MKQKGKNAKPRESKNKKYKKNKMKLLKILNEKYDDLRYEESKINSEIKKRHLQEEMVRSLTGTTKYKKGKYINFIK
jgi:hypothetical protein